MKTFYQLCFLCILQFKKPLPKANFMPIITIPFMNYLFHKN